MDPSLDAGSHAWPLSRAGEPEGWGLFCFTSSRKDLWQREEHLCCMNSGCQVKKNL